jgi:hypothetical protein
MDNIEHLDFEPGDPDEPLPEQPDGPGNSPVQQGSEIPLAWKPTPREPVPVTRCSQIKKDGTRCKRWSLRGYHKCKTHSGPGALMPDGNVNKYREAVIEAAKLRLLDMSEEALDTIWQLAQPGTGEAIRLKAATEVLDRAGIRGGFELSVEGEVTVSATDEIRKRLAGLKEGADEVRKMQAEQLAKVENSDGDVIDAEFYEEDPAQPSLFDEEEDEQ